MQGSSRVEIRTAHGRGLPPRRRGGFTILETLIVVGLLVAMGGAVALVATRTRSGATQLTCLANLKHVTQALNTFALENKGRYPDPGAAEQPWEKMISKYLSSPHMLVCPADSEIAPMTNSSYDWRDTTLPTATLAGRPMTEPRPDTILTIEALPGWHRQGLINVGRVDGSTLTMDANEAMGSLLKPVR